jgi:hypothetical protein
MQDHCHLRLNIQKVNLSAFNSSVPKDAFGQARFRFWTQ